ncbi:hypothetical protein Tco_1265629 [Tanacetum coccineum]
MKKANLYRSGVAYEGPSNPNKPSPKEVVERETEEITDEEQNDFQGSTAQIPPPVIPKPIPEPEIPKTLPKSTPIPEPEIPKTVPKANIPYPSRRDNQKNREKASYQKEKIFQMFQDLRFDISFADALFLIPRFAPTIRDLLMNKEKLLELVKIPLNENCSAMLLKKLPEKLGDPVMSFPHPIILSDYDVDDTFSTTHSPDYIPALPDYFPASSGNTSPNFSVDLTKDLLASLAFSPVYVDPYMKVVGRISTIF